jgi:tripartite-type tricarboxylate transporter receptor subunit TctC
MARLIALLLLTFCATAAAQSWPAKPLKLIIPFPPGGSNDVIGRAVGAQLAERLGQGVIIDNRGGAGGLSASMPPPSRPQTAIRCS